MIEPKEQQASLASRHIIERPRLTRLLDGTTARVIMLVAPAGYGKTTLVRQWLANRPHAWFDAGSASSDVASLIGRLGEVLTPFSEPEDDQVSALLRTADDPDILETIANLQMEQIGRWPSDAWLAIDGYEAVSMSKASSAYIETLLGGSKINLLLTSRVAPTWATPRRRLYGDYLIIEGGQLAMTDAEAKEVLRGREPDSLPALISAAAGWPAVLGLASLTKAHYFEGVLPQTLYDYFADELFQHASPALRRALPQLSLLPSISGDLLSSGLGVDNASALLDEARELGFVTGSGPDFHFQPLLRAFLRRKRTDGTKENEEIVERLLNFLIQQEEWNSAFEVIHAEPQAERLLRLIESAHEPLLRSGRTATLDEWLRFAMSIEAEAPLLDLIRSELAVRRGAVRYAERLTLSVVENAEDRTIATRALSIAGRAAHLDNRDSDALVHFRAAGELADDDRARQRAAWGALLAAQDLKNDDELRLVLGAFLEYGTDTPDDAVRAATAQFAVALTKNGIAGVIEPGLATLRAFRTSADPLAVTGLMNSLSRSLSLAARYGEARELAEEELDLAASANLQFVVPFGHVAQAAAFVGLRRYREAEDSLNLATRCAEDIGDDHNVFDALTMRARSAIAQGQVARAAELTTARLERNLSSGMRADYEATRGLALACAGEANEACSLLAEVERDSGIPEANALVRCARAVLALRAGASSDEAAREIELLFDLLFFDPLIVASRAYPELIDAAKATDRLLPQRLEEAMGPPRVPTKKEQLLASLTPREREVLELLTRGYTNREIAHTLVIAEVTAKVHVCRIIKKLGVRSRTEAAVAAIQSLG
jgi:DNA-binding CsgD family transcriptional regulator